MELEFPPLAILCRWGGRIFWPKAGVLVLRRSLGKLISVGEMRENREICACGAKMYACGAIFLRLQRFSITPPYGRVPWLWVLPVVDGHCLGALWIP